MNVYAFDRDSTVDVNPPDDGSRAFPLEWLRHLAHETEHVVWATGNQKLTEEADIPGDEEAAQLYIDRWGHPRDHIEDRPVSNLEVEVIDDSEAPDPDLTTALLDYLEDDVRLDRHQRVRLVAALHPDADRYIAVDNRYLGFIDGVEHYQGYELVEEVEQHIELGEVAPDASEVRGSRNSDGD